MKSSHPIWLAGFRPFFLLAIVAGAILPILWAGVFSASLSLYADGLTPTQWHSHEMLFGFGWAVLGGFLLTASKNWVGVRGIHGVTLMLATVLWICERIGIYFYGAFEQWARWGIVNGFIGFVAGYIIWTLLYYRRKDSFPDNFMFVIILPLFIVSKNMIVSEPWQLVGSTMAIGLFRVAFVVMFERTITQFMKSTFGIALLRNIYLDGAIKVFALLSVFEALFPAAVSVTILAIAGLLLGVRFLLWKPHRGFSNFGIALSYLGYLGLVVHFIFEALTLGGVLHPTGTVSVHIFTFLCMGIVIPAMMIRISQGHTGRKIEFTSPDRVAIASMSVGAFFRLVATQVWPQNYLLWIEIAAGGWALCFILLGIRLIPFLLRPRIDGRVT